MVTYFQRKKPQVFPLTMLRGSLWGGGGCFFFLHFRKKYDCISLQLVATQNPGLWNTSSHTARVTPSCKYPSCNTAVFLARKTEKKGDFKNSFESGAQTDTPPRSLIWLENMLLVKLFLEQPLQGTSDNTAFLVTRYIVTKVQLAVWH